MPSRFHAAEDRHLDRRVVNLWRLQALTSSALVVLGVLGGLFLVLPSAQGALPGRVLGAAVAGVLLAWLAVRVFVWPSLAWARFRWRLDQDVLRIRQGVLFHQQTAIPLNRIQHVDTREGPLEQLFGLARVLVWTASGPSPEGGIPGLDVVEARALRDELAHREGVDGV